jgi:hypothetical protein
MVPWMDGMRRNEVTGITVHQSGMNQNGRPFIELVSVSIRFSAEALAELSKLETAPGTFGGAVSPN